ncbi:MAG: hypothetical protein GY869_30110, partial [Planctomycetes bacterium]|nr:hypothetical protein [Planctomycetota bacterium]
ATNDPLARNLPPVYRAQNGSSFYRTPDQTVVVEKPGYGAVVINKEISWGNVVLIGHNYLDTNAEQNQLLANAVFTLPSPRDTLQIFPEDLFDIAGPQGGPFAPDQKTYTLANISASPLPWQITQAPTWLDFDYTSGTLDPGSSVTITAFVNSNATLLSKNTYSEFFTIKNIATGTTQNRLTSIHVASKYILAYTEFADTSYDNTYLHTLEAIRSINPDFAVCELDDYTKLESDLSQYNVILIPQQKFADNTQLIAIGAAWKTKLTNYIEHGGILIQCNTDDKFGILTGAGLMDISAGVRCNDSNLFVTDPQNPINQF